MKNPSIQYLRRKADKLAQQIFVANNPQCFICPKETSCGHHFFPKSTSTALRYDFDNWIPLCVGDHFRHHNGDPRIHAVIMKKRGEKWYKNLLKRKEQITKVSQKYYLEIINKLENYESSRKI